MATSVRLSHSLVCGKLTSVKASNDYSASKKAATKHSFSQRKLETCFTGSVIVSGKPVKGLYKSASAFECVASLSPSSAEADWRLKAPSDITVAVVGPTGYIGKFVTKELIARGYNVIAGRHESEKCKKNSCDALSDLPMLQLQEKKVALEGKSAKIKPFQSFKEQMLFLEM